MATAPAGNNRGEVVLAKMDMASSLGSTCDGTPLSGSKRIPLLCTVCPDAPRFSDVSHLLTHIASKGHLHHETQTKLRAHQDIAASVSLQRYEQWYRDNRIESLLVERMRAKQKKEAVKYRRSRDSPARSNSSSLRRKGRRSAAKLTIKDEEDDLTGSMPLFPGFYPSDNEIDFDDDLYSRDMLSLKGQIWPGMGKLDLANEDMKRTRNQRKPISVIEKMKRASEGIEPTQVIMTPSFEVDRVKGVYDPSSSPIPGLEEESPKKVVKPKRKKSQPLGELSVNVPRGAARRAARRLAASKDKLAKFGEENRQASLAMNSDNMPLRRIQETRRDDDSITGDMYNDHLFMTPSRREQRLDDRSRFGFSGLGFANAQVSTSSVTGDVAARIFPSRNLYRSRPHGNSYGSPHSRFAFPSVENSEPDFSIGEAPLYNYASRLNMSPLSGFGQMSNDFFQLNPNTQFQGKQEHHIDMSRSDVLQGTHTPHYLQMSETNPLLAQDRLGFVGHHHPTAPNQVVAALGLKANSSGKDFGNSLEQNQEDSAAMNSSKRPDGHCNETSGAKLPDVHRHASLDDGNAWLRAEDLAM